MAQVVQTARIRRERTLQVETRDYAVRIPENRCIQYRRPYFYVRHLCISRAHTHECLFVLGCLCTRVCVNMRHACMHVRLHSDTSLEGP